MTVSNQVPNSLGMAEYQASVDHELQSRRDFETHAGSLCTLPGHVAHLYFKITSYPLKLEHNGENFQN